MFIFILKEIFQLFFLCVFLLWGVPLFESSKTATELNKSKHGENTSKQIITDTARRPARGMFPVTKYRVPAHARTAYNCVEGVS